MAPAPDPSRILRIQALREAETTPRPGPWDLVFDRVRGGAVELGDPMTLKEFNRLEQSIRTRRKYPGWGGLRARRTKIGADQYTVIVEHHAEQEE